MTVWQLAAELGRTEPLEKIWGWAKAKLSTEELNNKLLLAKVDRKQTVWDYVSLWDNVQLLGRIWKWVQEQLTPQ
jgi:hypothetical protein